jgi:hypothetical protein
VGKQRRKRLQSADQPGTGASIEDRRTADTWHRMYLRLEVVSFEDP